MKAIAFLLSFAASVAAHGYVDNGTIGGAYYQVWTQALRCDLEQRY